ncbi:hypothetical protein GCM10010917_14760 [Paenibacillus physcomitrellae]|uniref:Uncharacterized protein n=1 Tax=Paenibacillus physcomitrellae TaxID=1619311 RepID=A0ABQ1FU06_9BACL|nr:hypothetical protein GCM10010917_14760 [Paenibacillus physcomitrellae]
MGFGIKRGINFGIKEIEIKRKCGGDRRIKKLPQRKPGFCPVSLG